MSFFDPADPLVEPLQLRNLTAAEIAELYGQHTRETGQIFTPEATALAWDLTHGQPWLVHALARQAVETVVPDAAQPVDVQHIEQARELLIERRGTHLDAIIDHLRDARVRRIVEPILAGQLLIPALLEDDIRFVEDLGLIAADPGGLVIANPIYREVVERALVWLTQEIDGS
jgi:hypothetical protein